MALEEQNLVYALFNLDDKISPFTVQSQGPCQRVGTGITADWHLWLAAY
jgi:hypothetical protein